MRTLRVPALAMSSVQHRQNGRPLRRRPSCHLVSAAGIPDLLKWESGNELALRWCHGSIPSIPRRGMVTVHISLRPRRCGKSFPLSPQGCRATKLHPSPSPVYGRTGGWALMRAAVTVITERAKLDETEQPNRESPPPSPPRLTITARLTPSGGALLSV